jgi:hypothetical protein
LKAGGAIGLGAGLAPDSLLAKIPPHNFDKYDFGGGPPVADQPYHRIQADRILNYYHQFPEAIDGLARQIGYRVRPSWVWTYEEGGYPGLIVGFVNDGIAAVPGVLRVSAVSSDGKVNVGGCLDAGYPLPGKGRSLLCRRERSGRDYV